MPISSHAASSELAASQPPLAPFSPKRLALGVMVVPSNAAYRAAARQTWLNDAIKHATVRFVAGDVPCAREALQREVDLHHDIAFVRSDDCKKWHSPAKVHAWYTYALKQYPDAIWIAKMEDDGILWTKALVGLLGQVRQPTKSVYFGMMQWQGGCEHSEARTAGGDEVQGCAGCWGGWFNNGAQAPRHCMPMWRERWSGSVKDKVDACPRFFLAPFACGPFEARSRHLALAVSRCEYAETYFAAMSRRGDAKKDWCVSADGGQGHAVGACVKQLHIADLGPHRQKYATEVQLNASHAVLVVHPIKSKGAEFDSRRLPWLLDQWRHMWNYQRRAPYELRPLTEAKLHFRHNETRPLVERMATFAPNAVLGKGAGGGKANGVKASSKQAAGISGRRLASAIPPPGAAFSVITV